MKKITSILLTAIILIVSVFSVNAFASEQTKAENLLDYLKTQNIECEFTAHSYSDGVSSDLHAFIKGENIALISDLSITETKTTKIKLIVADGYVYIYFPSFPFFHFKSNAPDDLFYFENEEASFENMTLVGTCEKTEYYVEKYADDTGRTIELYFIGDKLKKIDTFGTDEYGENIYGSFEIISDKVDDSVFQVPWYSIDISLYLGLFGEPDFSAFA